jgi:hypothetical protein
VGKPKVNEQAVQAQFQNISSLMQIMCGKMGPQTWQGGSAGRFTGEMVRNNQALASMMDGVWRAVKSVNKDNPPAPPQMPNVHSQLTSGAIASLNPDLADSLAAVLGDVADRLPRYGSQIVNLLEEGGTAASTKACASVASWCRSQVGTMRKRAEYARASDKVGKHVDFSYPGQSPVPDVDKFGSAEMAQLGKLQAQLLNQDIDHPVQGAPEDIARIGADLKENIKDPSYCKAFFGAGGVKRGNVAKIPYWLHQNNRDDKSHRRVSASVVIRDFGTALAALSRKKDPESKSETWNALGKAGSDMPGQGLLVKYSEGKWGSHALAQLAAAALHWRVQFHSYQLQWNNSPPEDPNAPMTGNNGAASQDSWWFEPWGIKAGDKKALIAYDPALNIFHKMNVTRDDVAARELANMDATNLKFGEPPAMAGSLGESSTLGRLLVAPDWLDGGKETGGIISLATHQTPAMNPDDKRQAARAATQMMEATSDWNIKYRQMLRYYLPGNRQALNILGLNATKPDLGRDLRNSLGQLAKEYVPSIAQATGKDTGHRTIVDPVTGTDYADINRDVANGFLQSVVTDQAMRRDLLASVVVYNREFLKYALTHHGMYSPHEAANFAGWAHKNVFDAYQAAVTATASDKDAARATLIKDLTLATTVASTIASPATGGIPALPFGVSLASIAVGSALDKLTRHARDNVQKQLDNMSSDYQVSVADAMLMALHDSGTRGNTVIVDGRTESIGKFFNRDGTLNWNALKNRESDEWSGLQHWAIHGAGENVVKTAQGGFAGQQP